MPINCTRVLIELTGKYVQSMSKRLIDGSMADEILAFRRSVITVNFAA